MLHNFSKYFDWMLKNLNQLQCLKRSIAWKIYALKSWLDRSQATTNVCLEIQIYNSDLAPIRKWNMRLQRTKRPRWWARLFLPKSTYRDTRCFSARECSSLDKSHRMLTSNPEIVPSEKEIKKLYWCTLGLFLLTVLELFCKNVSKYHFSGPLSLYVLIVDIFIHN